MFLEGARKQELDVVVGMRRDRRLTDGRLLAQVRSGESVTPLGSSFPVRVARYRLRRNGPWETRFVVANFEAPGRILARWGRRCNMSDMW